MKTMALTGMPNSAFVVIFCRPPTRIGGCRTDNTNVKKTDRYVRCTGAKFYLRFGVEPTT